MIQKHILQTGTFHITTNAKGKVPWCTIPGIPELIIDNLRMTKNLHNLVIIDFSLLPDHLHLILETDSVGISTIMHSFKRNSTRDTKTFLEGKILEDGMTCTGWQHGFHDEIICDEDQLRAAQSYVRWNAVKHGLVEIPEDWPWYSFHFEDLIG
jgi:putative transposase